MHQNNQLTANKFIEETKKPPELEAIFYKVCKYY